MKIIEGINDWFNKPIQKAAVLDEQNLIDLLNGETTTSNDVTFSMRKHADVNVTIEDIKTICKGKENSYVRDNVTTKYILTDIGYYKIVPLLDKVGISLD